MHEQPLTGGASSADAFVMLVSNFVLAVGRLLRSPSFAICAIGILGLALSVNTIVFTIVYDTLLKPLSFPQPDQLVAIKESVRGGRALTESLPVNANHFVYWQRHGRAFAGMGAMRVDVRPIGESNAERITVAQQTSGLFGVLGIKTQLGRLFGVEEDQIGRNSVVDLSFHLWQQRFGGDPEIVGKDIALDGRNCRVVGVLTPDSILPSGLVNASGNAVDAFMPIAWSEEILNESEGSHNYFAIGRLKPDRSIESARAELEQLQRLIGQNTPDKVAYGISITNLQEFWTAGTRRALYFALGACVAIMLLACLNVAGLLLSRAERFQGELAVRAALGASAFQLSATALAEPVVIALAGSGLGLLMAILAFPWMISQLPTDLPRVWQLHLDWQLAACCAGVEFAVCACCGCVLVALSVGPRVAFRTGGSRLTSGKNAVQIQSLLVTAQVVGSFTLLVAGGLCLTSISRLLQQGRGFSSERVICADTLLPSGKYHDDSTLAGFYERALRRIRSLPSVEQAGVISVAPLSGDNWGDVVAPIEDRRPLWQKERAHYRWISPGYLETMRVPLLAGRWLTEADRGKRVAVISKQVARRSWGTASAVGRYFRRMDSDESPLQVIGVVDDMRSIDLSEVPPPTVYVPYWYRSRNVASFLIRSKQSVAGFGPDLRRALRASEQQVVISAIRSMSEVTDASLAVRRLEMRLALLMAGAGLTLAVVGLYAILAHAIGRRAKEIGIRMALGASRVQIGGLVFRLGLVPVAIGLGLGLLTAYGLEQSMASRLWGVASFEPATFAGSTLILVIASSLACLAPARRAAQIQPLDALREE